MNSDLQQCITGIMIGDSLGLPFEGIKAGRIRRLAPNPLRHSLVFGHGMVSDDSEHAVMTALSLIESAGDHQTFGHLLARRLRWWFAGVPAGVGMATARACIKLWMGWPKERAGVPSAGNGPTMRAPVIGAFFNDPQLRREFCDASTLLTHTDPMALDAARLVALCASCARQKTDTADVLHALKAEISTPQFGDALLRIVEALNASQTVEEFASSFCRKPGFVSGFTLESTTVVIFTWLRCRGEFQQALEAIIRCGGDTDTTAAVLGGISALETTPQDIPESWTSAISDWPLTPAKLPLIKRFPCWPGSILRNIAFFAIVLWHGFRRLFPPYV